MPFPLSSYEDSSHIVSGLDRAIVLYKDKPPDVENDQASKRQRTSGHQTLDLNLNLDCQAPRACVFTG